MIVVTVTVIASVTAITITALLCFKGITLNKKMEVVEPRPRISVPRAPEMDEIEKKLNQADKINTQKPDPTAAAATSAAAADAAAQFSAMDAALRKIQDVFGPDPISPSDSPNQGGNV